MLLVLKITAFLLWVNLLPPLAGQIWGEKLSRPLDDELPIKRHPLFGPHKTIRGIMVSLAGGIAVFPLLGVPWWVAGIAALLAMSGDLLSSFAKRRLGLPSGADAIGLDQFFEGLFPTLFLGGYLHLAGWQILSALLFFIPLAYLGSRAWHVFTYRPPRHNYTSIIRSTSRLRAWRSCHFPLARWQVWFNLSSFLSYRVFYTWVFRLAGLEEPGRRNTLNMTVTTPVFRFNCLPESFDGFRILLLTDLHLDGLAGLTDRIIRRIRNLEVDLCLVGGDIRMETYGPMAPCLRRLRRLLSHVRSRHGILGVLGNHDCIEMTPDFEECGLFMLINDCWKISRNGSSIWIVGVDDPHYYRVDNARQAFRNVPAEEFRVFLAHSPEAYAAAAYFQADLYLCGHTHGGQICLPGRGPILTNSRAPRFTAVGAWQFQGMTGYTCRGAGASGIPLRFNCPGEISLITLRSGDPPVNVQEGEPAGTRVPS